MSHEMVNFILDLIPLVFIVCSYYGTDIYEAGAMLRLGLFLGFAWLIADDIDNLTHINLLPGDFRTWTFLRTGIFKIAIMIGIVLDLGRIYARKIYTDRMRGIVNFVQHRQ